MNKKILRLAYPNIFSNITVPLLGMVDLALMGHLDDVKYIGGIALGGVIFNFIYWGFAFLRMSSSGITAQAYGAADFKESYLVLYRSLFIALVGSLGLLIFQVPIEKLAFGVIDGDASVKSLAREYYYIRIWAAPATISLSALFGWFIGMQNAIIPMIISIAINILNISFSALFVMVLGMNSAGVALGTVIAQYGGLIMALFFLWKKYPDRLPLKRYLNEIINLKALKAYMKVGGDIFIRTLCVIFVFTFFTSKSAAQDNTILAVNTLLLQFLLFFSYFMDGFAYAAEALIGKYVGRGDRSHLLRCIHLLFRWGVGLGLIFTALYYWGGDGLLSIFSDKKDVIQGALPFMRWVVLLPLISFASYLWDGIYIGATASRGMLISVVLSTFVLFFPAYMVLQPQYGNHGLWIAMLLFMFGRSFFQTLMVRKAVLKKIKWRGED